MTLLARSAMCSDPQASAPPPTALHATSATPRARVGCRLDRPDGDEPLPPTPGVIVRRSVGRRERPYTAARSRTGWVQPLSISTEAAHRSLCRAGGTD